MTAEDFRPGEDAEILGLLALRDEPGEEGAGRRLDRAEAEAGGAGDGQKADLLAASQVATATIDQSMSDNVTTFFGPQRSVGLDRRKAPASAVTCTTRYTPMSSVWPKPKVVAARLEEKTMTVFTPSS